MKVSIRRLTPCDASRAAVRHAPRAAAAAERTDALGCDVTKEKSEKPFFSSKSPAMISSAAASARGGAFACDGGPG